MSSEINDIIQHQNNNQRAYKEKIAEINERIGGGRDLSSPELYGFKDALFRSWVDNVMRPRLINELVGHIQKSGGDGSGELGRVCDQFNEDVFATAADWKEVAYEHGWLSGEAICEGVRALLKDGPPEDPALRELFESHLGAIFVQLLMMKDGVKVYGDALHERYVARVNPSMAEILEAFLKENDDDIRVECRYLSDTQDGEGQVVRFLNSVEDLEAYEGEDIIFDVVRADEDSDHHAFVTPHRISTLVSRGFRLLSKMIRSVLNEFYDPDATSNYFFNFEDAEVRDRGSYYDWDYPSWEELCSQEGLEYSSDYEVAQWYSVRRAFAISSMPGTILSDAIDVGGDRLIWGRCGCGQALYNDSVVRDAAVMHGALDGIPPVGVLSDEALKRCERFLHTPNCWTGDFGFVDPATGKPRQIPGALLIGETSYGLPESYEGDRDGSEARCLTAFVLTSEEVLKGPECFRDVRILREETEAQGWSYRWYLIGSELQSVQTRSCYRVWGLALIPPLTPGE